MHALTFSETLACVMDFLDEEVTVRAGHVHPDGEATLAATLTGTLIFVGEQTTDDPDTTRHPVILGFVEHDCGVTVHPLVFDAAYHSSEALTIDMGAVILELQRA